MDMDRSRRASSGKNGRNASFVDLTTLDDEAGDDDIQFAQRHVNAPSRAYDEEADADADDPGDEEDEDAHDAWDVSSLFQDAAEALVAEPEVGHDEDDGHDTCTLEEARALRRQLRDLGPEEFFRVTIEANSITAPKLLTAFGIKPPAFLEGCPDESYYPLLSIAVSRELRKRLKLSQYNTINDAVDLLKRSQNIVVITGAGISTSLGIPDFRSKDIGLYAALEELGLHDPQQVFDIELFREDPSIFYTVAKKILPETTKFSPTHAFIRLLQDKDKLLTNYSQNIDNLEAAAGVRPDKLIQCHGSFATATCQKCQAKVPGEAIFDAIKSSRLPRCAACTRHLQAARPALKRKRTAHGASRRKAKRWDGKDSSSEDEGDADAPPAGAGIMKPDITFFGEALSEAFHERLAAHDRGRVDLVVVLGTSLKVAPVSEMAAFLPAGVPQIYVSREPVAHIDFDIELLGDCDVVVTELCRRAGWDLRHEMIPAGQRVGVATVEGCPSRHVFKAEVPPAIVKT